MRRRHQDGHVYERHGAFHVRHWTVSDGKRLQRSHKLCDKDDRHYSTKCAAVKSLCQEFMKKINVAQAGASEQDMKVTDFWEQRYWPYITRHKKASTVTGYKQIWSQHLKAHFGKLTLQGYKAHMGHQLLLGLVDL